MEGAVIIGIIIFVIWIISKKSGRSQQSGTNTVKTTYEPKYDYQKELERKLEAEKRKEQERLRKENEEQLRKKHEELKLIELKQRQQKQQAEKQKQIAERQRNWKTNWPDFQKVITEKNITVLYHFTDKANLQSIHDNGGLFSWYHCEKNSISIPKPGGLGFGRDLDLKYGLQDYVRLSFSKTQPMMYKAIYDNKINNPVILEIDIEVIYWNETMFSDMNATKTGHSHGKTLNDFLRIKFDIVKQVYNREMNDETKKYYQAEVMVKKHIPLAFIKNFNDFELDYSGNENLFDIEDDLPF